MKTRGAKRKEHEDAGSGDEDGVNKLPKPASTEPPMCPEDQPKPVATSLEEGGKSLRKESVICHEVDEEAAAESSARTPSTTDCDVAMATGNESVANLALGSEEDKGNETVEEAALQTFANKHVPGEANEGSQPESTNTSTETGQSNTENGDGEAELVYLVEEVLDRNAAKTIKELKKAGISSIHVLVANKDKLDGVDLKKKVCKELFNFCERYEKFQETSQGETWQDHADENWTKPLVQDQKINGVLSIKDPRLLFAYAKNTLHEGELPDLSKLSENDFQRMYDFVVDRVTDALSETLVKACHFPIRENSLRWIRAIFNLPSGEPYPRTFINSGRTQAGKTAVKAVIFAISLLLDINLFIITKGKQESRELFKKIQAFLIDCGYEINPALGGGSLLVVGIDTCAQITNMVRKMKIMREKNPNRKFIVINDECDALYRTEKSTQKMEAAHNALMKLSPCLRIEISATPMPTILILHKQDMKLEMMQIGKSDDYSGIEEMEAFCQKNRPVFLPEKPSEIKEGVEYSCANDGSRSWEDEHLQSDDNVPIFKDEFSTFDEPTDKFRSCHDLESIPYTTTSMMDLYKSACKPGKSESGKKKKNVLVLDILHPQGSTRQPIFLKACCIQNEMRAELKKDILLIVNTGAGICVRRPGFAKGRKVSKLRTLSEVLEQLDKEFKSDIPFFLFGYHKMRRGLSCRCKHRVPTHMVLYLGKGHSIDNYVQSLGRGTFNGLNSVLKTNGFSAVTVLTTESDLNMARAYIKFLDLLHDKLKAGNSPEDAIRGLAGKFPASANFLCHNQRKLGQLPQRKKCLTGLRYDLDESELFREDDDEDSEEDEEQEAEILEDDDEDYQGDNEKRERYWNDQVAQRVLKSFVDLREEERKFECTEKQVCKMFNDTYQFDGAEMKTGDLTVVLEKYMDDQIVQRIEQGTKILWKVINWDEIKFMLNEELVM